MENSNRGLHKCHVRGTKQRVLYTPCIARGSCRESRGLLSSTFAYLGVWRQIHTCTSPSIFRTLLFPWCPICPSIYAVTSLDLRNAEEGEMDRADSPGASAQWQRYMVPPNQTTRWLKWGTATFRHKARSESKIRNSVFHGRGLVGKAGVRAKLGEGGPQAKRYEVLQPPFPVGFPSADAGLHSCD